MLIEDNEVKEAMGNINASIARENLRDKSLELLDRLTNRNRAKQIWKKYGYEELKLVKEILTEAMEAAEAEYLEIQEKEKERQKVREDIELILMEKGMRIDDLLETRQIDGPIRKKAGRSRPKGSVPMRYKCHIFGKDWYWNGNNTLPDVFRCAFIRDGKKRKDYLLPESEQFTTTDKVVKSLKIPEEHHEEARQILNRDPK